MAREIGYKYKLYIAGKNVAHVYHVDHTQVHKKIHKNDTWYLNPGSLWCIEDELDKDESNHLTCSS